MYCLSDLCCLVTLYKVSLLILQTVWDFKGCLVCFWQAPRILSLPYFWFHWKFQCHHDFLAQVSQSVFLWLWWTLTKINLREEMFCFILHFMVQFITEGSQGRNSKKKPGDSNWSRSHAGILITIFLSLAYTDTFILESMPIYLGMALCAMLWPFHNKEQLIKHLTTQPQKILIEAIFSWVFIILGISSLHQVVKNRTPVLLNFEGENFVHCLNKHKVIF